VEAHPATVMTSKSNARFMGCNLTQARMPLLG
jgi:hypothetical protein